MAAFLVVIELTAALAAILYLLFLNYELRNLPSRKTTLLYWASGFFFIFYFVSAEVKRASFYDLGLAFFSDDYFQVSIAMAHSDVSGLSIMYYSTGAMFLLMFAAILFFATILCVSIFYTCKVNNYRTLDEAKAAFSLRRAIHFESFKRQQDLTHQNDRHSATRFVDSSKPTNVTEEESGDDKR